MTLLRIAIPLMFAELVQTLAPFFQTVFFAQVGGYYLAAMALIAPAVAMVFSFIISLLSALSILIAKAHGANDAKSISIILKSGFQVGFFVGIFGIIVLYFTPLVLNNLYQSSQLITLLKPFLIATIPGIIPWIFCMIIMEFYTGLGETALVFKFYLIETILIILFSYVFILGHFGSPPFYLLGAGIALSITDWLFLIIVIGYIFYSPRYHIYFKEHYKTFNNEVFFEIIKLGAPLAFNACISTVAILVLNLIIGLLGESYLAANRVVTQNLYLLFAVYHALSIAISINLNHYLGSHDLFKAKKVMHSGILLNLLISSSVFVLFYKFSSIIIGYEITQNQTSNEIIINTKAFIILGAFYQVIEAIRLALVGILNGLKETKMTFIISAGCMWLGTLPLTLLLVFVFKIGIVGVWISLICGNILATGFLYISYNQKLNLL